MKPNLAAPLLALAVISFPAAAWGAEPANLVPNGQLARTDEAAATPNGWEFVDEGHSGAKLVFVKGYFKQGAVEIVATSLPQGKRALVFRRDIPPLLDGRRYRLSFWAQGLDMGEKSTGRIIVSDEKEFIRASFNPLPNWAQVSFPFMVKRKPEGNVSVHIGLAGPGRLGIERVSLVEEPERKLGIGVEMVQNGDMEADGNNDGTPDFWVINQHQNRGHLGSDVGQGGGRCLTLMCEAVKGLYGVLACQFDTVHFKKDHFYEFTYDMRSSDSVSPRKVQVGFCTSNDYQTCGYYKPVPAPYDWRRFSEVFKATRTADQVRMQFGIGDPGLTIYIDNVSVREVPKRAEDLSLRVTPLWPDKQAGNLVPNASFEMGAAGWGSWSIAHPGTGYTEPASLLAEVDEGTAFHGKRSLTFELDRSDLPTSMEDISAFKCDHTWQMVWPLEHLFVGVHGWRQLGRGKPYVLSAWCKTDAEGAAARLTIQYFDKWRPVRVETKAPLSTEWTRCVLSFSAEGDYAVGMVGLDLGAGKVDRARIWIDAVQLEPGAEPTPFVTRQACETALSTDQPGNIFDKGDTLKVKAHASNNSDAEIHAESKLIVTDYWDRKVFERNVTFDLAVHAGAEKLIDTGLTRAGFYRVKLAEKDAADALPYADLRCAIIEPVDNSPYAGQTRTCVDHGYSWSRTLELAKKAGITQFREWGPFAWDTVEAAKGKCNLAESDMMVDRLRALGDAVHGVLHHPSSTWSSSAPPVDNFDEMGPPVSKNHQPNYQRRRAYQRRFYVMPRDLGEMAEYTRRVVKHFHGRVGSWEILNEPKGYRMSPQDYAAYLAAASRAVRSVDPKLPVLGGWDTGPEGHGAYKGIFDLGAFEHMDIVSIHVYPVDFPPEGFIASMREFNKMMKQYGDPKPFWITEQAYWADDDPPWLPIHYNLLKSERQHGDYLARFAIIMYLHGTDKIFYHSGAHSTLVSGVIGSQFFEYGDVPRKSYAVVAALSRMIPSDAKAVELLVKGGVFAGLFERKSDAVAIVWGPAKDMEATFPSDGVKVLDIFAEEFPPGSVVIGETPVYVVAPDVDELRKALRATVDLP